MATFKQIEKQIKRMSPLSSCVLIGQPGVGKTEFIIDLANKLGLILVKVRCAESGDTGDFTGLLYEVNGVHYHTKPNWMEFDKPVLLFLDEINRAKKDVINAIMQLCTEEQEFNGNKLPSGSRVIAAMNSAKFASNDVDEVNRALFSRFARIHVDVSKSEFLLWGSLHGVHKDILDYIEDSPIEHLFNMGDVEDFEDEATVNPRSWTHFSRTYTNGCMNGDYDEEPECIKSDAASHLGPAEALRFYSWLTTKKQFNSHDYLLETSKVRVVAKANQVSTLLDTYKSIICDSIMGSVISLLGNPKYDANARTVIGNLYTLLDRLPVEHAGRMYTKYIEPHIKADVKPDWIIKLAHTDENIWSKIKTIIQGKKKG